MSLSPASPSGNSVVVRFSSSGTGGGAAALPLPAPDPAAEPAALPEPAAEPAALPEPAAEPAALPDPAALPLPAFAGGGTGFISITVSRPHQYGSPPVCVRRSMRRIFLSLLNSSATRSESDLSQSTTEPMFGECDVSRVH